MRCDLRARASKQHRTVVFSKLKRTCSSLSELETVTTVDGGRAARKAARDVDARSSFGVMSVDF